MLVGVVVVTKAAAAPSARFVSHSSRSARRRPLASHSTPGRRLAISHRPRLMAGWLGLEQDAAATAAGFRPTDATRPGEDGARGALQPSAGRPTWPPGRRLAEGHDGRVVTNKQSHNLIWPGRCSHYLAGATCSPHLSPANCWARPAAVQILQIRGPELAARLFAGAAELTIHRLEARRAQS